MSVLSVRRRVLVILAALVVTASLVIFFTPQQYKKYPQDLITNWRSAPSYYRDPMEADYRYKCQPQTTPNTAATPRANATFVVLARNSDLWGIMSSLRQIEDRFNHRYNYPIVFLNDKPFDEEFKRHTSALWSGNASYGLVPPEQWQVPSWIDEEKAAESRKVLHEKKILYAGSVPYRQMCRYLSGFFFRHELLLPYKWYWRVEPDVQYYCDIDDDPFLYMEQNNKVYGFVISMHDYIETIATLWDSVKKYMQNFPQHISPKNSFKFITDNNGESYNTAHFWSNFEIGSLDFWRSKAYLDFFETLDKDGGFFYERWGDAPVHSVAAALLLRYDQIHLFDTIGYKHNPFVHCPESPSMIGKCHCNPADIIDHHPWSFNDRWIRFFNNGGKADDEL